MKKTALVLVLVLSMLCSLVACGAGNTTPTTVADQAQSDKAQGEQPQNSEQPSDKGESQPAATTVADKAAAKPFEGRTLNVVATSEKYKELFDKFTAETGAKVEFLSMSSGEVLSRVKAEGKPMADLWFGGGLDAFIAAKNDGILSAYTPKEADKIDAKFKDPEGFWIAKGITVVGFLANNEILKEKNLPIPKTWAELADPKYKDEVIMSTPAVSGTMFAAVKGILDKMGEKDGWAYWEKLVQNIPFFGKRGKDPMEKTITGEFAVGIIPADNNAFKAAKEHNLTVVYPEDGIPWVPEGVAIFKDAPGKDIAEAFEDFMLRDDIQEDLARIDGKDGHQMIKPGIKGYDLGLKPELLIKENLPEFGTMRDAILKHWTELTQGKETK